MPFEDLVWLEDYYLHSLLLVVYIQVSDDFLFGLYASLGIILSLQYAYSYYCFFFVLFNNALTSAVFS